VGNFVAKMDKQNEVTNDGLLQSVLLLFIFYINKMSRVYTDWKNRGCISSIITVKKGEEKDKEINFI
jgi:hypothetical protein